VKRVPFLYLSLPLPPMPLFKNTQDRSIIPQVPLFNLLRRFEGVDEELLPDGSRRKMYITRLPQYLVLHYQRFQKNSWFVEKNLTLVNFPLRGLDMRRYLSPPELLDAAALRTWSVARLKQELVARGASAEGAVEKRELEERLLEAARRAAEEFERLPTRYDLIANICHEGTAQQGSFRVHVLHRATDTWYDVQDLNITTAESQDSMAKQVVAVSEAYIQVYELRQREEEADAPLRGGVGPR
jgi:U4/U6.U5 tri-snRNP-associated protein 2